MPFPGGPTILGVDRGPPRVGSKALHALEERGQIRIAPALAAVGSSPLVKVGFGGVVVPHCAEGGGAAEDFASGPVEGAVCQAGLLDCIVVPVMLGVEEFGEEDGNFGFKDFGVVAASFEEQDRDVFVLGEFVGEDTACCAGADDYFYKGVQSVTSNYNTEFYCQSLHIP